MQYPKFKKVFNVSYLNVLGLREHRRGTFPPEEPDEVRKIDFFYADELPKACLASKFKSQPPTWIVKERISDICPKYKGKLVCTHIIPKRFDGIRTLKFTYDKLNLIAGYGSGNIEVWPVMMEQEEEDDDDEVEKQEPVTIKPAQKGFPITSMSFIPDSKKFFAASTCGGLYLCTIDPPGFEEFAKEFDNEINAIDVNLNNSNIITGGKDAAIRIYDIDTCKQTNEFMRNNSLSSYCTEDNLYHSLHIFAVKFHPDYPELFISGGWDGYVKIWDTRVHNGCVRNIHGPYISGDAIEIKNTDIITGSFKKKDCLQLWDVNSGKLIENISLQNRLSFVNGEFIKNLKYFKGDPLEGTIVTGGSSSNVEVIDVNQKKIVYHFPVNKSIIAIDTSENYLAFGGYENLLKVVKYV